MRHHRALRLALSVTLLVGGAGALVVGVYLLAGLAVALIAGGVLALAAEWLVP